jgi:hypothetical protein
MAALAALAAASANGTLGELGKGPRYPQVCEGEGGQGRGCNLTITHPTLCWAAACSRARLQAAAVGRLRHP